MSRFRHGWINFQKWVRHGVALWLVIGVMLALYLATYNFPVEFIFPERLKDGCAEFPDRVRWFGILLEMIAIGIIAFGLSRAVAAFNQPQLVVRFFRWVADFRYIFIRRPPRTAEAQVMLKGVSVVAGVATGTVGSNATVQEQLDHLKRSVTALQESMGNVNGRIDQMKREISERFSQEATERELAEQRLKEALELHTIGDVHIQIAGLFLLLISIFMANAPTESALLLRSVGLGYTACG